MKTPSEYELATQKTTEMLVSSPAVGCISSMTITKVYEEFTGKIVVDGLTVTYKGHHRDWDPVPNYTPPTPTVWEAWTTDLPANWNPHEACVLGGSKEDVVARLEKHVGNIKWWNDMSKEEKAEYIKKMRQ